MPSKPINSKKFEPNDYLLCLVLLTAIIPVGFMPVFADSTLGVLNFKQIITDTSGQKYVIGEVQNNDPDNSIESTVYFGNTTSQYHLGKYIGVVGHGMAMPFKIEVPDGFQSNLSELNLDSHATYAQPNDLLKVDYSTLYMDKEKHAISGILRNRSPLDAYNIAVFAIAMDAHAKVLDVTQSVPIYKIPSNGSASFTLTPINSVSKDVSYYSCFVPGQSGQNYTLPAENNQTITFEIGSDGEVKNVNYDKVTHTISFHIEGVFPQGGWAELMVLSPPDSYSNSQSLSVTLNDQNDTKSLSDLQMMGGKEYKHVSFLFPIGKNVASIKPSTLVPEFPLAPIVLLASISSVIVFYRMKFRK